MKVSDLEWNETTQLQGENTLYTAKVEDFGRFTVLDRLTGWGGGRRDIETGFTDLKESFWLASGMFDIRTYPDLSIESAAELVKEYSFGEMKNA
jgi:hypothetical protein